MGGETAAPNRLRLVFPATELDVRAAIQHLLAAMPVCGLTLDARGTAEIVLVETLNNIVEHAYAGEVGEIDLRLQLEGPFLLVEVVDFGKPLPQEALPAKSLPDCDLLPEGGFGWFLIHSLSQDLRYQRKSGSNLLTFRLPAL